MAVLARRLITGFLAAMTAGLVAATPGPAVAPATPADRILVDKSERRMDLMAGGLVIRSYDAATGRAAASR